MTAAATSMRNVIIALALAASTASAQTPVRDAHKPSPSSTGVLAGVIATDDRDVRPLRRARVGLVAADRSVTQTVVTDDDGRFDFAGLPPGRYRVTATKQGYLTMSYGSKRPLRAGTTIVLADGERLTNITIRLPRGAVIAGTVVDHTGEPLSGGSVRVLRRAFAGSGQRQLVSAGGAQTDERGQYRVWGLAAGEYFVSAAMIGGEGPSSDVPIARVTDAEVKRALADVSAGAGVGGPPAPTGTSNEDASRPRTVGYAAVYYPGTFNASQAAAVSVAVGEERTGIDFSLSLVPTAKIEGTVTRPEGAAANSIMLRLVTSATETASTFDMFHSAFVGPDGIFSIANVPPGMYKIVARAASAGVSAAQGSNAGTATPPRESLWAMTDVAVDGQDVTGVSLTLQESITLAGRVQFEGSGPPPDPKPIRIMLSFPQTPGEVTIVPQSVQPDAAGAFSITSVVPGRYRLTAVIPGANAYGSAWQLKSAMIGDLNAAEAPVDVRTGVEGAVITFTDRVSQLAGLVQDGSGKAVPEYGVLAFSADKALWVSLSRRVRYTTPDADGRYLMPNLPPGDYFLCAVGDLEPGEWYDPALLDQLSRSALRVTLAEGEKKTQDLRLAVQIP
jgi:protocatechuate 3,4-dioxygenase beta subunit